MRRHHPDLVIRLIGLLKLGKAMVLIAIATGALMLWRHPEGALGEWLDALVFDPHGKHFHRLMVRITALDDRQLEEIGIGGLVYAAVFVVEGIGLMLRRAWAEVMTVIVTTSFIPLEIYELIERRSAAKAVVIVVNVGVVLYLLRRLRRERHWPFHR